MGHACRAAARAIREEDTPNYTAVLGRAGGSSLRPSARSGRYIELTNGDVFEELVSCGQVFAERHCDILQRVLLGVTLRPATGKPWNRDAEALVTVLKCVESRHCGLFECVR